MGKGDKKSKKGKIWRDSYGNSRKKRAIKAKLKRTTTSRKEAPATTASEATAKPKRTAKKKADA